MKYIALLVIVISPVLAFSQNVKTSTLRWSSHRTFDVSNGQSKDEFTSIISAASGIVWKNADGTTRKTFQVVEVIGEWSDPASDGKIQFEVNDGQSNGSVSIQRKENVTRVLIVIGTEPPTLQELTIQNFQQL
jgi:hypothetical protein